LKLHTIIVNWRTPALTLDAIRAAARESATWGAPIVVVDNDSQDGSMQKIEAGLAGIEGRERVVLIASPRNGGYGYGNNLGFRRGLEATERPEYFYVLNSDAFPEPRSIEILVDFMDANPRVGIAGSYVHGVDGKPHETAFRFPSAAGDLEAHIRLGLVTRMFAESVVAMPMPTRATRVDWVSGASMIIRRELLERIGLFDEAFFLYFEETDLAMRALAAGWETWYVPESSVAHVGSVSTGIQDLDKRTPRYWFDSRRRYFLKHGGREALWKANAGLLGGAVLFELRRRLQAKPRQDAPSFIRDFVRHTLRGAE